MSRQVQVVYFESLLFEHWALYIRHGRDDFEVFEVHGGTGTFRYNAGKTANPKTDASRRGIVSLGTIPAKKVERLREFAEQQEIRRHWNWNCQNWVMNLFYALNEEEIINVLKNIINKLLKSRESLDDGFDPDYPDRIPNDDEDE